MKPHLSPCITALLQPAAAACSLHITALPHLAAIMVKARSGQKSVYCTNTHSRCPGPSPEPETKTNFSPSPLFLLLCAALSGDSCIQFNQRHSPQHMSCKSALRHPIGLVGDEVSRDGAWSASGPARTLQQGVILVLLQLTERALRNDLYLQERHLIPTF